MLAPHSPWHHLLIFFLALSAVQLDRGLIPTSQLPPMPALIPCEVLHESGPLATGLLVSRGLAIDNR